MPIIGRQQEKKGFQDIKRLIFLCVAIPDNKGDPLIIKLLI